MALPPGANGLAVTGKQTNTARETCKAGFRVCVVFPAHAHPIPMTAFARAGRDAYGTIRIILPNGSVVCQRVGRALPLRQHVAEHFAGGPVTGSSRPDSSRCAAARKLARASSFDTQDAGISGLDVPGHVDQHDALAAVEQQQRL
jgi:hypothetical protein